MTVAQNHTALMDAQNHSLDSCTKHLDGCTHYMEIRVKKIFAE